MQRKFHVRPGEKLGKTEIGKEKNKTNVQLEEEKEPKS